MTDYDIMWSKLKQEVCSKQQDSIESDANRKNWIDSFSPGFATKVKTILLYLLSIFYLFGIAGAGIFFTWQIAIGNFNYFYLFMIPACAALVWLMIPYRKKEEKGFLLDKNTYATLYKEVADNCKNAKVPVPGEIRLLTKFHFEVVPRACAAPSLQLGGALFAILDEKELAALIVKEMYRYKLTHRADSAFLRSAKRSMISFTETLFDLLPDGHRHKVLNQGVTNQGAIFAAAMKGGHTSTDTMTVMGANAALAIGFVIFFPVFRFFRSLVAAMHILPWQVKHGAVYEADRFCAGLFGTAMCQRLIKKLYTPTTYLRSIAGFPFEEVHHLYEMKERYAQLIQDELDNALKEMEQNLYRKDYFSPHELKRLDQLEAQSLHQSIQFGVVPGIYGLVPDIEGQVFKHIARGSLRIRTRGF